MIVAVTANSTENAYSLAARVSAKGFMISRIPRTSSSAYTFSLNRIVRFGAVVSMSSRAMNSLQGSGSQANTQAALLLHRFHDLYVIHLDLNPQAVFSVWEFSHFRSNDLADGRVVDIVSHVERHAWGCTRPLFKLFLHQSIPQKIPMGRGCKSRDRANHWLVKIPDFARHYVTIASPFMKLS